MVTSRFALLASPVIGAALADELWALLDDPDAVAERILERLAANGIKNIPDFTLVEITDVATRTVSCFARGVAKVSVTSHPDSAVYEISGDPVLAWSEATIAGAGAIHLFAGTSAEAGDRLPLARGVVRSNSIRL